MLNEAPPKIRLDRSQWLRLILVGLFAAVVLGRTLPDAMRVVYPLGIFGYATDNDGVIVRVPEKVHKGDDRLVLGDRVRIDRLKYADRKPGFVPVPFTRENYDRRLPIDRRGKALLVRLHAETEPATGRLVAVVRILILIATVVLASMLVLAKPNVATCAFFIYCLSGQFPTSIADTYFEMPWRPVPSVVGDGMRGMGSVALLVFAATFVVAPARRPLLAVSGIVCAVALGVLDAYALYALHFTGAPAAGLLGTYHTIDELCTVGAMIALGIAFVRSHGVDRQRSGWIVTAFAIASFAQLLSDRLFPAHLTILQNALLLALGVLPVVAVWVAVVKLHFFNVDFVVSRGIIYTFIIGCLIAALGLAEEVSSYVTVMNTDLAQAIYSFIFLVLGALLGRFHNVIELFIDRFIFPNRRKQRKTLERIGANILDAQSDEAVYHAMLDEAADALGLEFSGIMSKTHDGSYRLTHKNDWPEDYDVSLPTNHPLVRAIERSRNALSFDSKATKLIRARGFPNERLQFAAPIFFERSVAAIVVYGSNKSGLDLDPSERQMLVRIVAHASIALNDIELHRLRAGVFELMERPADYPDFSR